MIFKFVMFLFYLNCCLCSLTHYKASVSDVSKTDITINEYDLLILETAKSNVDLLVLTPMKIGAETLDSCVTILNTYDQVVKVLSKAAKTAGIYVVAQLYDMTKCQYRDEFFNDMVFDRDGGIVAAYRNPVSTASKCNATESNIFKFSTDFGVTFALVTEEDIILHRIEYFDGVKNFIVSGFESNCPFLNAEQFTSSWSFMNKVNVVSPSGLFGANLDTLDNLIVAEFQKNGGSSPLVTTSSHEGLHHLHQITKSLNMEASVQGYTDTVCDGGFCCNFYVKTSDIDISASYALSAHKDVVQLGLKRVAVQACAVSSKMSTGIKFDKITITANFTNDSAQFPSVTTKEPSVLNKLILENNSAELFDFNVLTFGVLIRDYNNDIELQNKTNIDTEYISYENINDFFDYVWIRVRVLAFILSIYILEML